jgi:acyl carrier protein
MTTPGRALIAELVGPSFAARLEAGADLVRSGVNSGDLVRLALLIEERYGTELASDEMGQLHTIDGIDRLIERLAGASRPSPEGARMGQEKLIVEGGK